MQYKILLVSADPFLQEYVFRIADEESFSVQVVSAGKGIQETAHQVRPDLLIINWQLPDINGMAVLRSVIDKNPADQPPIIMIGPEVSQEQRILALELGADLCLTMPVPSKVFLAHLRSLLRRNHTLNGIRG